MTHAVDELVSLDDLQEKIAEFEDYIQSSDVAAMQSKRCRFHYVERESDLISEL
jgi:elongation factor 1-beta